MGVENHAERIREVNAAAYTATAESRQVTSPGIGPFPPLLHGFKNGPILQVDFVIKLGCQRVDDEVGWKHWFPGGIDAL